MNKAAKLYEGVEALIVYTAVSNHKEFLLKELDDLYMGYAGTAEGRGIVLAMDYIRSRPLTDINGDAIVTS